MVMIVTKLIIVSALSVENDLHEFLTLNYLKQNVLYLLEQDKSPDIEQQRLYL